MTDDERSEEFVRFIKDNREMILRILAEDDDCADEETRNHEAKSERRSDDYTKPVRDLFIEGSDRVLKVLADEEVQRHFVTGCMEAIMCLEAMVRAMPMSDEMREMVDNAEKARDTAVRKAAMTEAKSSVKDKVEVEKINVKKKVSEGVEHVRDVKDSIFRHGSDNSEQE